MSSKTLSQQVSFEPICAVLIIFVILSVPKYFKLPDSLELLFHDMFGQILLLLFAVLVGSYSFLCGVLLVILFISIMLQTQSSVAVSEGFVGAQDADMVLKAPKTQEEFEDQPVSSAMTNATKITSSPMMQTPMATSGPQIAGASTPAPTFMASEAKFPSDVEGYKTTIKKLEEELNECKATNLTLKSNMSSSAGAEPLPTMGTNKSSKTESFEDVEEESKLEEKARKITVMSTDEGSEEFEGEMEEDIEEGFCGCDRSDNRVKLAKLVAQSEPSFSNNSPYENFQNSPPVPQTKAASVNPYDVAGCRYDNDFEKDLHDTFYGPPLASCRAYNGSNKAIGTLFYPMN